MNKKIGQLLIIGIKGKSLSDDEIKFITSNNIGGIILFERNIESPQQLFTLCSQLHSLKKMMNLETPLFIAIDMEGGRVHRLKPPFTQWPAQKRLGEIDSTAVSFKFGFHMGLELGAVGINLNFAPCIDTLTNPNNKVIGDRSISADPESVAKHASALIRGFIKSGIIPCAKHFPGHGNTLIDSHEDLPIEELTLAELEKVQLIPFKKALRARLDLIMTSHIKFKKIDPDWPVTLSPVFINNLLKKEWRYRNLVITDDLDMKALVKNYDRKLIPIQALKAGADILLYCNDPTSPALALECIRMGIEKGELNVDALNESYNKIIALKKNYLTRTLNQEDMGRILGHPDHLRLAKAIESGDISDDLRTT